MPDFANNIKMIFIVRGKMILPSRGKDILHPTVSSFFT